METRRISIDDVVLNEGQIAGLPTNPRQWTRKELETLKKSIRETPELFDARGVIVYPMDGKYVVLGGNMRLSASRELKMKDVPCIVLPADTSVDKMKEIVIKDNGAFGAWDYEQLANEWDDVPLTDWGVPAWDTDDAKNDDAEDDAKEMVDLSDKIDFQYKVEITCVNEEEQEKMYNELTDRGFECKILTL